MSVTTGIFSVPVSGSIYLTLVYDLSLELLSESQEVTITKLPEGATLTKLELVVETGFSSASDCELEISHSDGTVLMGELLNDPSSTGTYVNSANKGVINTDSLVITHNLDNAWSGNAKLRVHYVDAPSEYLRFITSQDNYYATSNGIRVDVLSD